MSSNLHLREPTRNLTFKLIFLTIRLDNVCEGIRGYSTTVQPVVQANVTIN